MLSFLTAVLTPADHNVTVPFIRITHRQFVTEFRHQGRSSSRVVDLIRPDGSETEWGLKDTADTSVQLPLSYVPDDAMDGNPNAVTTDAESSVGTGTHKPRLGDSVADNMEQDSGDDTTHSRYSRPVPRATAHGKGNAQ